MKKPIIALMLCSLLVACSSDSEAIEKVEPKNKAPESPVLSSPENSLFCTTNSLNFSWLPASDPEKDPVTYILEISSKSDFAEVFSKTESSSLSLTKELEMGQNYYWRVLARDNKGNSSAYSAVRNLYTEGESVSNSLPSVPVVIHPEEAGVTGLEVELAWEATDPDNDELSFDLYFGTSETPPLFREDLAASTCNLPSLESGTTYYWQIAVIDENGGKTIGQVWSFKTGS